MTYIIIFITAVISIICFRNGELFSKLILEPYMVTHRGQWYRIITHGFVHGDYTHLLVNLLVLWSFGTNMEKILLLQQYAGVIGSSTLWSLLLYFGGMIVASVYDVIKQKDNPNYSSVGASGAVSAVVFASIFFNPLGMIYIMGAIPIPGIVFGIAYIVFESYSARRQNDNINHYAHIFGSVYGFIFPLLMSPSLIHVFLSAFQRL